MPKLTIVDNTFSSILKLLLHNNDKNPLIFAQKCLYLHNGISICYSLKYLRNNFNIISAFQSLAGRTVALQDKTDVLITFHP